MARRRARPSPQQLIDGIRDGDRAMLARAITLVESTRDDHHANAQEVLTAIMPYTGEAHRVGITGVPGVGKSTFIEALGTLLTRQGHRVAVLAVDPSSARSGGSILGDKTRMEHLSRDPNAFVRPSPTSGTLGGVARRTREATLLCEAAGYDVILIETVGVGQSETVVANMVDSFLVLMLAGAGDELQGIKRGLMELTDVMVINKADGDNQRPALVAARTYQNALHYLHPPDSPWQPPVLTCSALHNTHVDTVWNTLREHRDAMQSAGRWLTRRQNQNIDWMWSLIDDRLRRNMRTHPNVQPHINGLETQVRDNAIPASTAADRLYDIFLGDRG